MQIACTKKLYAELKIAPAPSEKINPLFSWRANLITLNRRKTVVLMCDHNQYVVVLYGLKAKDFKELDKRITAAIRSTLLKQHINPEVIDKYLTDSGAICYVKNSDRSLTAKLINACEYTRYMAVYTEDTTGCSDMLGVLVNRNYVGDGSGGYYHPYEKMSQDLKQLGIEPVVCYKALELTATLALERQDAVRKLIVPADITFLQLHYVLQVAFEWQSYHLFSFAVYDGDKPESEPIVELVCDEEDLQYKEDARMIEGVALSEYLPEYKYLLYTYDFGDGWEHYIEVTGVFECFTDSAPVLIDGEGNSPPEDVGGPYGFEDFLAVMANPEHEEYESMKQWSEGQGYFDFNLEKVNRNVESILQWQYYGL